MEISDTQAQAMKRESTASVNKVSHNKPPTRRDNSKPRGGQRFRKPHRPKQNTTWLVAEICRLLRELTHKEKPWKWIQARGKAFVTLKDKL